MANYVIQQVGERSWSVLDEGAASWYVIEGEERALVIDTGITTGAHIMPTVRELTDKPVVLALTHAHYDHMYHADEFATVYMSHREFELDAELLDMFTQGRADSLRNAIDIRTGDLIDLGGRTLEVCEVPGHTPGSVVFYDASQNLLFCGDALGSGIGVWMQLPGVTSLYEYRDGLVSLARWLMERGGRMRFYPGHAGQQFQSQIMPGGYNPQGMGLLMDMIELVDGLIKGTIVGRPSAAPVYLTHLRALHATYGRAEIEYVPEWMETGSRL